MLAGMGGVSMAPLVAAVSNAGGLGIMGAANLSPDDLRDEIREDAGAHARSRSRSTCWRRSRR